MSGRWRARGVILTAAVAGLAAASGAAVAVAGGAGDTAVQQPNANTPYDGRFTFVRLSYETGMSGFRGGRGGFGRDGCWGGDPPWMHDYPCAETNLASILSELSFIRPYRGGSNILSLGDPELFRYPVAYMSEPGYWRPTDREAAALREYLLKGGFVIFDDFRGRDWYPFEQGLKKALPDAELMRLDGSESIFHTFFEIESLENVVPPYGGQMPEWWGVFENNDRNARLMAVASFNNDLGDYWEYSGQGFYPIDMTNEAYKLGVNYIIYAMTR
jgi:hypothetical protein